MQIQHYILGKKSMFNGGKTIGVGSCGKVKEAIHEIVERKVAIKILEKPGSFSFIQREILICKRLQHQNIIQLLEILESPKYLYLVMELAKDGDLLHLIKQNRQLTESAAVGYFVQLLEGVNYCHCNDIIHRDIKPDNILISDGVIKLTDFGLSSSQGSELLTTYCGSPCYAAPEQLRGVPYNGRASDIWSCGVVLYVMLHGRIPFDDDDKWKMYKKIQEDPLVVEGVSDKMERLLHMLLQKDPSKRITYAQISKFLNTPLNKTINVIDYKIVKEVTQFGFQAKDIIQALHSNKLNTLTTCYYLLRQKSTQIKQRSQSTNVQIKKFVVKRHKSNLRCATDANEDKNKLSILCANFKEQKLNIYQQLKTISLKKNNFILLMQTK